MWPLFWLKLKRFFFSSSIWLLNRTLLSQLCFLSQLKEVLGRECAAWLLEWVWICVCFHSNWRTAWTTLGRNGFSTQAMERFMGRRWVVWYSGDTVGTPKHQACHRSFLPYRSTFRSRMPLAGTISAPPFSWISSCRFASTSPLLGQHSFAFLFKLKKKNPTPKIGII